MCCDAPKPNAESSISCAFLCGGGGAAPRPGASNLRRSASDGRVERLASMVPRAVSTSSRSIVLRESNEDAKVLLVLSVSACED